MKETQKNNGIKSGWITNYCKEQFRAKEKSKPPVIPEKESTLGAIPRSCN